MARHRPRPAQRRPARARHPVRLRALRRARRGHDRERHHLPRAQRRRARSARRSAFRRTRSTGSAALLRRFEYARRPRTRSTAQLARGAASTATTRACALFARLFQRDPGPAAPPRPALGRHGDRARARSTRVVPLEPASMPGRVVVQWDKDDCADLGHRQGRPARPRHDGGARGLASRCPRRATAIEVDLAHLPHGRPEGLRHAAEGRHHRRVPGGEPRADGHAAAHEARASSTTSWSRSRSSGPGPIVGQDGAPVPQPPRRAASRSTYAHPSLEPMLQRTLGVPLFQEQLLRMAMMVAGLHAAARPRSCGAPWASSAREKRMQRDRGDACARAWPQNGITGEDAGRRSCARITSFALYGFPESHAASFALIAYASAYLKCHHPAPSPARCSTTSRWASTTRSRW